MKKIRDIFSGNEGFTLIELLIVIVIIGVLAAIAIPNLAGLEDSADKEAVRANMRTLMVELESHKAQYNDVDFQWSSTGEDLDITDDGDETFDSSAIPSLNQQEVYFTVEKTDADGDYEITAQDAEDDPDWTVSISNGSITTTGF